MLDANDDANNDAIDDDDSDDDDDDAIDDDDGYRCDAIYKFTNGYCARHTPHAACMYT